MLNRGSGATFTAILVMLTATSCNRELAAIEPTYSMVSDDSVRIEVQFDADDAKFVKNKEIYLGLTSHECGDRENRYAAEAYVGESAVVDFDFPIEAERVTFHGHVPAEVFSQFEQPCLILTGGSFLGRTVSSESIPIKPKE